MGGPPSQYPVTDTMGQAGVVEHRGRDLRVPSEQGKEWTSRTHCGDLRGREGSWRTWNGRRQGRKEEALSGNVHQEFVLSQKVRTNDGEVHVRK